MIRHSKSLFASLTLHSILLLLIIVAWQNWPKKEKEPEKKICLKMCHIQEPKIIPKKIESIVEKPKIIPPPPPKKIVKPKVKPKKKPKKKIVKKRIKPKPKPKKKIVPLVKKVPKKVIEPKIEPIPIPIIEEEPIVQKIVQQLPQETQAQKAKRLEKDYLDKHLKKIVRLLRDNLYYPRSARKRGITGEVMVKFKLLQNGLIEYVKVTASKSDILSRAATRTIQDLSGDFPKPKEALTLHVPISYALH